MVVVVRGIKNGIVSVCNQRAGSGGAIKNVCFGLRLRDRGRRSCRLGFASAVSVGFLLVAGLLVSGSLVGGLLLGSFLI
jgi:hypothetical protein